MPGMFYKCKSLSLQIFFAKNVQVPETPLIIEQNSQDGSQHKPKAPVKPEDKYIFAFSTFIND